MNIIFCTSSSTKSGGSRQALYLGQELVRRGHHLTFFTPEESTLRTLAPDMNWANLPRKKQHWKAAIEAALPQNEPAVFHAFHNKAVKKAAWWGLSWRSRGVVCVGHRGVVFKPGNPLPYWSPGIAAFVVNSQACADVLAKYGVGAKRLHVVYNGIPEERTIAAQSPEDMRKQLAIPSTDFVFSTVAGNNPVKGVDILLHAFAKASLPKSKLVLVGVSPEQWTPLADELGITNSIRMIQHTENVADYLAMSNGFVMPSRSESMPNTLLEAIRMGLPCIATDVGGVSELLTNNGLLIPSENPQAMAEALQTFVTDSSKRAEWQKNSQIRAMEFSIGNRADRIETIYKNILAARGLSTK